MNQDISAIDLEELTASTEGHSVSLSPLNLDLVGHLSVAVEVCVGTANITLDKLFSLRSGETLELKEELNSPVTVMVDGKAVAYGHLVAVNDHFGVQISEVAK